VRQRPRQAKSRRKTPLLRKYAGQTGMGEADSWLGLADGENGLASRLEAFRDHDYTRNGSPVPPTNVTHAMPGALQLRFWLAGLSVDG
jgi:hypothetical protein